MNVEDLENEKELDKFLAEHPDLDFIYTKIIDVYNLRHDYTKIASPEFTKIREFMVPYIEVLYQRYQWHLAHKNMTLSHCLKVILTEEWLKDNTIFDELRKIWKTPLTSIKFGI